MKTFLYTFLALTVILLLFGSGAAMSQDYGAAATALENAGSQIRMGEGAVGQALMEAMGGNYGEFHKWSMIDDKMNEFGKTIDAALPQISQNAAVLLSYDPGYRISPVQLGHPFEGNLNMARDKKRELLDLAKQENAKRDKLNSMIAKVDKELLNAAKGLMGATVEGFLPDEVQLGGEASVIVLSAWFGPPGMAVAALAVGATFTFNSMVNLYYNTKAAADQTKALTNMKQILQNNLKTVEENLRTLESGAREMLQIEQVLDKHQKKMEEYRAKVDGAMKGMDQLALSAYDKKKAELAEEAKKRAEAPKPTIQVGLGYVGMSPIAPIQPGEYSGDVDSIVSQMESYCKAVEDGGDPDNFSDLVSTWYKGLYDKYKAQESTFTKNKEAYDRANEAGWKALEPVYEAASRASNAFWAAVDSHAPNDTRNALLSAWIAASNRAQAGYDAFINSLKPFGQALIAPYREMVRINQIHYRVQDPYSTFRYRVSGAVRFRTAEFWKELELHRLRFEDSTFKLGQALSKLPYYTEGWKQGVKRIDADVAHAFEWGSDVASVRNSLLGSAAQLKQIDKDVKEGVKAYDEALPEVRRVINAGQNELDSLITKYGKVINNPRAESYYMGWFGGSLEVFTPNTTETSERVKYLSKYVRDTLNYVEPEYLTEVKKTDWLGFAAAYEAKATELAFYTDWADKYRDRLFTAVSRLTKISKDITEQGFYAARGGTPGDILAKEWGESPWASISQGINNYVTADDYKKLPWASYQPWGSMSPWQKLYAAQNVLITKLNDEAKYYVQGLSSGWFQPVRDDIMKPLEEAWKGLRPLCAQYDAAAGPIRDKISPVVEVIGKEILAVADNWNKMPQLSRNLVAGDQSRFGAEAQWLYSYVTQKLDALKTSLVPPNNSVAVQLDQLVLGYAAAFAKYKQQQEEMERQMEEARRQREAEEQKRVEEERKKQEAEKQKAETSVALVKDLYAKFKAAYESRNDSAVVSYLAGDWTAEGASISDLQNNLRRTFRVFDEVRYNIENLAILQMGDGVYGVTYDVTITSKIYKRNLKHEEKSSVSEQVVIESPGKAKIKRTNGGRFWYTQ